MANFGAPIYHLEMDGSQPMMWDTVLDQQMFDTYNQIPQQTTAGVYGSLDSSDASSPASASEASSSRSMSTTAPNKTALDTRSPLPDKVERRREQNRQSQRAYRDRKEKHQRDLEGQITAWKAKHERLSTSFAAQTAEVSQLKAQIEDLNSQIVSLQSGMPDTWGQIDHTQQDFDLVPFYDRKSGSWSRDSDDS